jgi:hypothetical protein
MQPYVAWQRFISTTEPHYPNQGVRARPRDAPDEEGQAVLTTTEKIHLADVDRGSAHFVTVTAANAAGIGQFPHLVREDGGVMFADTGYKDSACEPGVA